MDKDKLIEFAKEQCEIFPEDSEMGKYLRETLKMLQAEPCEDAVSRAEVLKGYIEVGMADGLKIYSEKAIPVEYINNLPPVAPTRKKGHWKYNKCSVCGASRPPLFDNFCPNCGAEMGNEE